MDRLIWNIYNTFHSLDYYLYENSVYELSVSYAPSSPLWHLADAKVARDYSKAIVDNINYISVRDYSTRIHTYIS